MRDITAQFEPHCWALLQRLAAACADAGGRALLVGGCLRSALLGEPVDDFDVEVFGIAPAVLEGVLRRTGPVAKVGKAFGIYKLGGVPVDVGLPRRERKSGHGHRGFEVDIDPGMPVAEAALRRDFTVNAIYFDILNRQIEDPLGGVADLEARCLRHCSERFPEDPLRVLRAMQLAARLPAQVAPRTTVLCSGLSPEGLSRERFFGEWQKLLLLGKVPSQGLRFLEECQWIRYFPELAAMAGCPQDGAWHPEGDVWTHTLHCMDAFARGRSGNREEDLVVGFAVLCHDMGKPLTTEVGPDGRIRSPGHEAAGLKPAAHFLERLNVPHRLVEMILPLVKCHMRPGALHNARSSAPAIRRLARDCGRLDLLLRVFQADAAGRPPMQDNSDEAIAWVRAEARRLDVESSRPKPVLRGADLLARGWHSGPAMGRFLTQAYEAQLEGAFTTHDEALAWLAANAPPGGPTGSA